MATLAPTSLMLYDLCPGPISFDLPAADVSGDVFGNSTHCNVSTAKYKLGTKIAYYDTSNTGWSIMAYLRYNSGSGTVTAADGQIAGQVIETTGFPYDVTSDGDTADQIYGYAAIMVISMTTTYYGWFWVGGVCPTQKAPNLAAATSTITSATGDVVAGELLTLVDAGDNLGLDNVGTLSKPIVAVALAADA